jgi:type III restriction enzyme
VVTRAGRRTTIRTIELEKLARERRLQRIVFETASELFDQVRGPDWKGTRTTSSRS